MTALGPYAGQYPPVPQPGAAGHQPVGLYGHHPGYPYGGNPGDPGPGAGEPQKSFMAQWVIVFIGSIVIG